MFTLKLVFRPWRLQPLSQILTFTTLGVLMFLAGLFGWLSYSLPVLRGKLEGDRIASVFIDPAADLPTLENVRDQIRVSLGSSSARVEYVSPERFVEILSERQPELAKEVVALGSEKDWIAPKHFSIRGAIGAAEVERFKAIPGVESVTYSEKRFRPIVENLNAMEWLSRLLCVAIAFAMLAVLFLLSRINSSTFAEAEIIVSQMGGSDWQARLPSRLNPFLSAISASVLAAALFWKVQPSVAHKIGSLSPFLRGIESNSQVPTAGILLIGLGVGLAALLLAPKHAQTEVTA